MCSRQFPRVITAVLFQLPTLMPQYRSGYLFVLNEACAGLVNTSFVSHDCFPTAQSNSTTAATHNRKLLPVATSPRQLYYLYSPQDDGRMPLPTTDFISCLKQVSECCAAFLGERFGQSRSINIAPQLVKYSTQYRCNPICAFTALVRRYIPTAVRQTISLVGCFSSG